MRGRVAVLTMMMVCVTVTGMLHVEAMNEPTRAAARTSVTLAPVTVQTLPTGVVPERKFRNIFAPLTTQPVQTPTVSTGVTLRLSAMVDSVTFQETAATYTAAEKVHYDALLAEAFSKFPGHHTAPLEKLTLKKSRTGSRGLAGASVMILRTLGVTDQEFVAVAIHELGHVVDLGTLKGNSTTGASAFKDGATPVWRSDLSVLFYSISWDNEETRRGDAQDFVSGYAMQDPFEDFAETFAMYVLHGERFRTLATKNKALEAKYAFMRDVLFGGQEFSGIDAISPREPIDARPWDVTQEPYNREAFRAASFAL